MVGIVTSMQWRQRSDSMYLVTRGLIGALRVWKMLESKGSFDLQLLWGAGLRELCLADANLDGVEGLSPANFKLTHQRSRAYGDSDTSDGEIVIDLDD
ncbi:hypothetical protein BGX33_002055, partial [Mortierella sp. NVP41]